MTLLAPVLLVGLLHADVPQFAKAIARAEGFYVANSKAARFHNPGNLRQGGRYRRFRSNKDGWSALYLQLIKIRAGESRVYSVDMTLSQFGKKYADGNRVWARNVAKILGVNPSIRISEIWIVQIQTVEEWRNLRIDEVNAMPAIRGTVPKETTFQEN